jgi:hypothetical protein
MSSSNLDDETSTDSVDGGPAGPGELPLFEPYQAPAGDWGALQATAKTLREQSVVLKGGKLLLSMNQPDGFDCPGCAWPDPKHTSSFEFCENGGRWGTQIRPNSIPPGARRMRQLFCISFSCAGLDRTTFPTAQTCAEASRPRLLSGDNPLLPLAHHDRKSKTPAAKSIPVVVRLQ